jgi:hypothetical protein
VYGKKRRGEGCAERSEALERGALEKGSRKG